MGLVRLPARKDYWRQDPNNWPVHPLATEISRDRFDFIWRHIHLDNVTAVDDIDESILEVDDGAVIPGTEQYVVVETVDDNTPEADADRPPTLEEIQQNEKWYKKAALILDHVNEFSKTVCVYPGFNLSIDEMMKLFKGRSH